MTAGAITLALDAMGGDAAPRMVVAGADRALDDHPDVRFRLFGDGAILEPLLKGYPRLRARSELRHTDEVVADDAKPTTALRQARASSMRLAVDAVRQHEADAAVSAGNTGALMAMAKVLLRTLPGIDRPAIASVMPAAKRPVVILDLGANAECDATNLVQFALMGSVFARTVLGVEEPSVALLNIGTEALKGDDVVQQAANRLRAGELPIRFEGFVEGTGLMAGSVDVVVTDGFTGNVALKVAEGTARLIIDRFRDTLADSWAAKLGVLLARRSLGRLKAKLDPQRYNGAMFLGLGGVVVKSHGSADASGFANAINVAVDLVNGSANGRIGEELAQYAQPVSEAAS
ncbi:MAG: phosphate acyltransferase PlsX [Alphaproteobacteria bacterium]|nr:phosphate acyltransferase PlsX [Alphaproteobacteria bacterium]